MFPDNRGINLCWFEHHYQAALPKVICKHILLLCVADVTCNYTMQICISCFSDRGWPLWEIVVRFGLTKGHMSVLH